MQNNKIPVWIYPPSNKRVAYLLADSGIELFNSIKGSSVHARSMMHAFHREGCFVDVYAMRTGAPREKPPWKFQQVKQTRLTRWWHKRVLKPRLWRKFGVKSKSTPNWIDGVHWLLWHRSFYRYTIKRLRRRPPNLIYARHAWLAFPYVKIKKALGVPLLLEVNAVMTLEREDRGQAAFKNTARRIEKEIFDAADLILPVSQEIKDQIVRHFGIDPAKIEVTPNAVDLEKFKPRQDRPDPRESGRFTICTINSFRDYHGNITLMKAMGFLREKIPGARLLMIGAGPKFERDKQKANELGVADLIEFTGMLDHDEVPRRLAEADVCASPNEGGVNQYNCPMKLFEYMAAGIPIVASDWGDIPNIIENERTGLLHAPGDPQALARALVEIYENPATARERAGAALESLYNRTWQATAQKLLGRPVRRPSDDFDPIAVERARTLDYLQAVYPQSRFRKRDQAHPFEWRTMPETHLPADGSVEIPEHYTEDPALPGTFAIPEDIDLAELNRFRYKQVADAAIGDPVTPPLTQTLRALNRHSLAVRLKTACFDGCFRAMMKAVEWLPAPKKTPAPTDRPIHAMILTSPINHGGVAKVCLQTLMASDPAQVRFTLQVFNEKHADASPIQGYKHIEMRSRLLNLWPHKPCFDIFRDIWRLSRAIKCIRPDIVHFHEPQYAPAIYTAARLAGCGRVIAQLHNDYNVRHQTMSRNLLDVYLGALKRMAIIGSSHTIYTAARVLVGPAHSPICCIMDGSDDKGEFPTEKGLIESLREAAGGRPVIAMLAHLKPHKRIVDFVAACRMLLDEGYEIFCLPVSYGKFNDAQRFRRKFQYMFAPEEGEFLYKVQNPPFMLGEVAIGVSTSCIEGFGLNILEFQRAGVPVVCTDLYPHQEMVEDEISGLLFPSGDVVKLAAQLRRLLDSPELRRRLGEAGRQSAKKLKWANSAHDTVDFYREVMRADN